MLRASILAIFALLVFGLHAVPVAAVPDDCGREPAGSPTAYVGAWIPAARDDPGRALEQDPLGRFNALAGRNISIVMRWEHWAQGGRIDTQWLRRVVAAGAFPMITWMPWNPDRPDPERETRFLMRDVANGAHDAYISQVAADAAGWDGPLFLRFAQEMNGTWYPFGKHQNSPDEYVAAWRHVHAIFEQQGAGHVTWVWTVSEKNHPETLALWYPGDDVVDWVAVDGYNWDHPSYWRDWRSGDTWRLLDQVFGPSFADLATFVPPDKPRMIAETASTERDGDPAMKATWICDAFRRALPDSLPEVKAVLWFQEQKSEGPNPFFWPVDTSPGSAEAFRAALATPYYVADLGDLPMRLGRTKIPEPATLPR
jgi:hypothetical protein